MNTTSLTPTRFEPQAPVTGGMIPLSVPEIRGNEWKYIKECLDTNWVSSAGPFVDRLAREMAAYVGTKYAIATCSGTAALHIALLVAGVQPDNEVLVPTLTFIAPANAIRYVGAWPIFIDVEQDYWQIDPHKVADFLEKKCRWMNGELLNRTTGRQVKAILPVHILGHPVDMDPIVEVARKYNLVIIEDATESLGARYKGRMVGSLGDIACFSFNGNKIITTGGGGLIVTDNEAWADKAEYLTTQAKDDAVESIHNEIGYNYRLTNIQAAMGCAQMEQLSDYIVAKRRIASGYSEALEEVAGISTMREAAWAFGTFWLYTVLVDETQYGMNSRELLNRLSEARIQARPLWQPLHCSLAHVTSTSNVYDVSERLSSQTLSLPSSVGLLPGQQNAVVDAIRSCCRSSQL